jgi:hypothetical protein
MTSDRWLVTTDPDLAGGCLLRETEGGLLLGWTATASFAYDLNTSTYYPIGPVNTGIVGGSAAGYAVGRPGGSGGSRRGCATIDNGHRGGVECRRDGAAFAKEVCA